MTITTSDAKGREYLSNLHSYVAIHHITRSFESIKKITGKRFPQKFEFMDKVGRCPFCGGDGNQHDEKYGPIYCVCKMLDYIEEQQNKLSPYRCAIEPVYLNQLKNWGMPDQQLSLANAIALATSFIDYPDRWLVLSGQKGCGKSHILKSIANEFGPPALYLPVADFERYSYQALQDGNFNSFISVLQNVPILLLDDWGSEHGKGFAKNQLRAVIDHRYTFFPHLPIVVATNLANAQMFDYDQRVASRLMDTTKTDYHFMMVGDYRTKEM